MEGKHLRLQMVGATINEGHIKESWEFLGTENGNAEAAQGLVQEDSLISPCLFPTTKLVCEVYNLYNLGVIYIIDMKWSFPVKLAGLEFFFLM